MAAVMLLLVLLAASECDSTKVKGQTGQNITLNCKYDRRYYGALEFCWERGELPRSGCYNQLISSDGYRVKTRASSRYELLGRLQDGDVSLTILNLTEGDAGRYGCRVRTPGLFNDEKHHFDLTVVTAPHIFTTITTITETPATTAGHTGSDVTATEFTRTQTQAEVTPVQQVNSLKIFIGNSVRLSLIIFIAALLLTAAHRVWRCDQRLKTDSRLNQSEEGEEEEDSPV